MLEFALILAASLCFAAILTPIVRQVAIRFDIVDHPDPHRKLHGRIVARAGGTAVLFSVLLTCGGALMTYQASAFTQERLVTFGGLFAAMIGMWLLGLADDVFTLRGRQKLLGQICLAALLVGCGFKISVVEIVGFKLDLGMLTWPVSMVWLLATTNALNLIDGADGLCSTLGAIICGALGILAAGYGHFAEAAIAFAMMGALGGFLIYNFPPAKIFLGDSGSLLIGLVTGALAIRCSLKEPTAVTMLAPLAILTLPLFDSLMAIVRRKLTGRSIYTTDRAHIHHTLRNKGLGARSLLAVVAILSITTAGSAIAGQMLGYDWISAVGAAAVLATLIMTKGFGYAEMVLVLRRGSHFARSLLERSKSDDLVREKAVRLQGVREWETVWATVIEFAEKEGLSKLNLDLNVPWLEEGYHGTWHRAKQPERAEKWSTSLPIHASNRIAGRIDLCGKSDGSSTLGCMVRLVELLEDMTPQLEYLMGDDKFRKPTPTPTPQPAGVVEEEATEPVYS